MLGKLWISAYKTSISDRFKYNFFPESWEKLWGLKYWCWTGQGTGGAITVYWAGGLLTYYDIWGQLWPARALHSTAAAELTKAGICQEHCNCQKSFINRQTRKQPSPLPPLRFLCASFRKWQHPWHAFADTKIYNLRNLCCFNSLINFNVWIIKITNWWYKYHKKPWQGCSC